MKIQFKCLAGGAIVSLFLLISILQGARAASDPSTDVSANCDIQNRACVQPLGEGSVTLEILPRPVEAMANLTFVVTLDGLDPTENPAIELGMPGMSMGPNHVALEKRPEGTFAGTGVIVRCPSGKTLWKAEVIVPGRGTALFTFDVVY